MTRDSRDFADSAQTAARHDLARRKYRRHAPWFDFVAAPFVGAAYQAEAVACLNLKPGDVVIDVACGTGSNFAAIQEGIGPSGRLIGIDLSREMLQRAEARVLSHGWANVTLVHAPIEQARIDAAADALLFSFTHDVLQSPPALRHLFRHARRGARVAACGLRLPPPWRVFSTFIILQAARQYHTIQSGLAKPWAHLAAFVPDLEIRSRAFATVYIAAGRAAAGPQRKPRSRRERACSSPPA